MELMVTQGRRHRVTSPPALPPPRSGGTRAGALPAAWQLRHGARPRSCPCPGWPRLCQCRCKSSLASADWSPSHPWCHGEQSRAVPVIKQTPLCTISPAAPLFCPHLSPGTFSLSRSPGGVAVPRGSAVAQHHPHQGCFHHQRALSY